MRVAAFTKPVLVTGRQNMNRAMQGDIVAIEMLPRSEWRAPADAVVDQDSESGIRISTLLTLYYNFLISKML